LHYIKEIKSPARERLEGVSHKQTRKLKSKQTLRLMQHNPLP
jgi:hypothetical protein